MTNSSSNLLTADLKQQLAEFRFPYLTASLPGTGGELKRETGDFVVDEIPVYEPCGTGEHLFVRVQKKGISGPELLQHASRVLGLRADEIGCAGLKDQQAITRQYLSVPAGYEEKIGQIESAQIQILSTARHKNKLKTGHLAGNRFSILVRDTKPGAFEQALRIRAVLLDRGIPNYYGEQRFGQAGRTVHFGLQSLFKPASRVRGKRARFELSAVQSWLFNLALEQRLADDLFNTVLAGDVMQVRKSGGPFVAEEVSREQQRFDAGETAVSGPIFGPEMKMPQAGTLDRETGLLDRTGLTRADFARHRKLCRGTRRTYSLLLSGIDIQPEETGLRFRFELPPGAYATVVLREFVKAEEAFV